MKALKLFNYLLYFSILISFPLVAQDCDVNSGRIAIEGSSSVCVDDGENDNLMVSVEGNSGDGGWIITDDNGTILGLPDAPPFNFEGVPLGTCVIWHISSDGPVEGLMMQEKIFFLEGCFDLSNPVAVNRYSTPNGGEIVTTDGLTEFSICAGDGGPDPFTVEVNGAEGQNSAWVITDEALNILALPPGPTFDLDGAGGGTCLVWYIRWNGDLVGADVGANAADLSGCFDLSNPITVVRNGVEAAIISTDGETELSICAGDGEPDPFTVEVEGGSGPNSLWVITDDELNILATPEGPTFDLDGAGPGTCLVWYLTYADDVDLSVTNAAELEGCFALSNPITVVRNEVMAASISTDGITEFSICVDEEPDPFTVDVEGGSGDNAIWVITDDELNILATPEGPTFDLNGAGPGTCLVWYLTYADDVDLSVTNAAELEGCFALSNPITVVRNEVTAAQIQTTDGLTEFSICAGDGEPDPFTVDVEGGSGPNSLWVITDDELNILATPEGPTFDLDGAGPGTCLVWYLTYTDDVDLSVTNAAELEGCFALSNPITVIRNEVMAASISTDGITEFSICVDEEPDPFTVDVEGGSGDNAIWVITDDELNILATPEGPTFDLNGAGPGTCLVWYLTYADGTDLSVTNAADLEGCFALSNPITVVRNEVTAAEIETTDGETELSICAGNGEPDPFTVDVEGGSGDNAIWVITDDELNILATPEGPTFDLDGAGTGTCLVWYLTYADGTDLSVTNAAELEGCFALSNPITVVRNEATAAQIQTTDGLTEFSICVDEEPDPFTVEVEGGAGDNAIWVITDDKLNILATPEGPTFDLNGAGPGTCLVWYLTYADDVNLDITNAADLEGCFALSNPITVVRNEVSAATIATTNGETELLICAGDGEADPFTVEVEGGSGPNALWVITDDEFNILATPEGPTFDLEGAGTGTCLVWYLTYGDDVNLDVENATDLEGCFALSNPITVFRQHPSECLAKCAPPMNIVVTDIKRNRARLDWDDMPSGLFYYTRYRPVGSMYWNYAFSSKSNVNLRRLESDTEYEAQILTYCSTGEFSDWSDPVFFQTLDKNNGKSDDDDKFERRAELNLFPNPVSNELNLETNLQGDKVSINIFSADGQLVKSLSFNDNEFRKLDASNLSQGTYVISINNGEEMVSKTFIKN